MLVLSRSKGEALAIGVNIVVEIVEIRGDKVRIGVMCPTEMPVHRQEVWEAIRRYDAGNPLSQKGNGEGGSP